MTEKITPLYERIGGEEAIARIVDRFYDRVVADPQLGPFFRATSMDKLRRKQREFFAAVLDGPQSYTGLALTQARMPGGASPSTT